MERLKGAAALTEQDVGEFSHFKGKMMKISVHSYAVEDWGSLSLLESRGMAGLMRRDMLVINSCVKDIPVLVIQYMGLFGRRMLQVHVLDVMKDKTAAGRFASLGGMAEQSGTAVQETPVEWYTPMQLPGSVTVTGKSSQLEQLAGDVAVSYLAAAAQVRQTGAVEGRYLRLRKLMSQLFDHGGFGYDAIRVCLQQQNTEDLYKGIEYMVNDEMANGVKLITRPACERICRFAFDYARKNGRKKVTAVHKANIMKLTDGLFLRTFREVASHYPEITADDCIIDALCMKLVQKPEQFDVLVAPNLYGDIISDLCAGLVGGLGFAPSANIGDNTRIYEAVHGSAPDIAGQDKANPSAILMAFAMMLNDLGETEKAARLNAAILAQVAEGKVVTADIGGTAGTKEFTQAVIDRL